MTVFPGSAMQSREYSVELRIGQMDTLALEFPVELVTG